MKHSLKNNLPLLHVYTLGELWLWSLFYRSLLGKNSVLNRHFLPFMVVISALVIANTLFLQSIWGFNSNSKTLVHLLVIVYTLTYAFYLPLELDQKRDITYSSLRNINSLNMLYYCATLFLFMSTGFWKDNHEVSKILITFNKQLNTLYHLLMLLTLWKVTIYLATSSSLRESVH